MITGPAQKPPSNLLYGGFYGDNWDRGLDPWHRDGFPTHIAHIAPRKDEVRREGWFLLDACGNQIGFIPDGIEINTEKEN